MWTPVQTASEIKIVLMNDIKKGIEFSFLSELLWMIRELSFFPCYIAWSKKRKKKQISRTCDYNHEITISKLFFNYYFGLSSKYLLSLLNGDFPLFWFLKCCFSKFSNSFGMNLNNFIQSTTIIIHYHGSEFQTPFLCTKVKSYVWILLLCKSDC